MKLSLTATAFFLFPVLVFAGAGNPVQHKHGDRSHAHPLPATGKNHSHNQKSPKSKQKRTAGKGWTNFEESKDTWYDLKDGSYERIKTKAGVTVESGIFKNVDKKTNVIEIQKIYVSKKDCLKGYGTVVYLKPSGDYITEVSYADDAGSIASSRAGALCSTAKKNAAKGI